jgi:hypothetical protein
VFADQLSGALDQSDQEIERTAAKTNRFVSFKQ